MSRSASPLLVVVASLIGALPLTAQPNPESTLPAPEAIQASVEASARYLVANTRLNGQFVYRINTDANRSLKRKYNILRHAGSIYSLCQYQTRNPNPKVLDAIMRACDFLRESSLAPVDGVPDALAAWSDPVLSGTGDPRQVKLGGCGLALVALASLETLQPGSSPLAERQGLARFILHLQKEDGSFYSKYIPSRGGKQDNWTSLYYPGEAALGLVLLHVQDSDPRWLEGAHQTLRYLARSRKGQVEVPADHWALLATEQLLPRIPEADRPELIEHARQIVRQIVRSQVRDRNNPAFGAFTSDGRTTPAATRLEGLLAALAFLPVEETGLRNQVSATCSRGVGFLLRSQILEGHFVGGFPRAIRVLPEGHPNFNVDFNKRATEIRVDYVQHAMSCMIQYQDLMKVLQPSDPPPTGQRTSGR